MVAPSEPSHRAPVLERAILAGERVRLCPTETAHAAEAFRILHRRDEILRWLVWEGPEREEELARHFAAWRRELDGAFDYHFAILERATQRFCGQISPRFAGHPGHADVGYWSRPEVWGRGYMTEAVRLVTWLCFRRLDAVTTYAHAFLGNESSRRVLEKSGYVVSHRVRGQTIKRGEPVDEWVLVCTRDDFARTYEGWEPAVAEVTLEGE